MGSKSHPFKARKEKLYVPLASRLSQKLGFWNFNGHQILLGKKSLFIHKIGQKSRVSSSILNFL